MARYLNYGETDVRPDAYFNYDKKGTGPVAGASDGVTAVLFKSKWGPLNTPIVRNVNEGYEDAFGAGLEVIDLTYEGGTRDAILVRVGTGGTKGTITLKNNAQTPANAVTITAKYVGSRAFTATIRDSISDNTVRECIIYEGTKVVESVQYAASANDEPAALVAAFAGSNNFDAVLASVSITGKMADVTQSAFTAGTDPTASTTEYSAGMATLEQYEQNCIIADSSDYTVISLLNAYCARMLLAGKMIFGVGCEEKTTALATRVTHAAACNSANMVYVIDGNVEHGTYGTIDGYKTAAKIAGLISGTSCKFSLTHTVLSGVTALNENLTDSQIKDAELKGGLVLTLNSDRQVWIDNAITTLVTPAGNQDEGWKKIRRTKTRFEMMTRSNKTVEIMVGKVDNDQPGRIAIMDAIREVGDAMIGEGKLVYVSVSEDAAHPAQGDSCWFIIDVIDKDSAEHIYLRYLFRYSTQLLEAA